MNQLAILMTRDFKHGKSTATVLARVSSVEFEVKYWNAEFDDSGASASMAACFSKKS